MSLFTEPPPQNLDGKVGGILHQWFARLLPILHPPVAISEGGTGQTTAQNAINALTQVSAATSGYVLTKDPANGNADWQPGGGGSGLVNSVTSTDPALTVSPTTGAVVASTNDFVGDAGAGGTHGVVPAPAAGDGAAGKVLKADGTWGTATSGTVTSVGLSAPAEFTVTGSPVTSSGTLALDKATESANTVWAGPTTGAAAQPAFRALVAADMPAGTGTVTSVALSMPSEFSVSGSPVTTSGTLSVTKANESANVVFAGPGSGGAAAPTFRSLVTADLPAGTGTVTSIATTSPISGGTITTTGTISHATSGVTAASYGSATQVGTFTVNATGHITAASNVGISGAGGGSLVLLATYTPSGAASVDITSVLSSTYDEYMIEIIDLVNGTATQLLNMLVSVDNGANWFAGTGRWAANTADTSGVNTAGGGATSLPASWPLGTHNNAANHTSSYTIRAMNMNSASYKHFVLLGNYYSAATTLAYRSSGFVVETTSAINALQFIYASGTLTGTVRVYGIATT